MSRQDAKREGLGADALIEDIFGLNIRGLGTIKDMIAAPRIVYEAARAADWAGRYTPSIRLVFSLVALMSFFRFLWAGEDTPFVEAIVEGLATAEPNLSSEELRKKAMDLVAAYAAALPIVWVAAHLAVATVLRVWGRGTKAVLRIRLYFLTIVPSMTLTLAFTFLMPFVGQNAVAFNLALIVAVVLLDGATAMRGGVAGKGHRKIARAASFAAAALIAGVAANVLATIISGLVV